MKLVSPINKQKVFDTVASHLLTQHRKSMNKNGMCMYRGPSGTRCAIGVLISDKQYVPEFEGKDVPHLVGAVHGWDLDTWDEEFLADLQEIHDGANAKQWRKRLKLFASRWDIAYRGGKYE